jgi:hypothetical protein
MTEQHDEPMTTDEERWSKRAMHLATELGAEDDEGACASIYEAIRAAVLDEREALMREFELRAHGWRVNLARERAGGLDEAVDVIRGRAVP